ncbi:hypothetical protein GGH99_000888 [Coemansia sp. RSA 1285]|nr:hypothetical protein EV177_001648 [Coemansia sp. RSA 1804]KAJ2693993.1 hypothetical protein GGH99_000888 [Coemansia sp. RSA 1285]
MSISIANTDIPPAGTYNVYSPENPYKRYGFLTQEERFKADRAADERAGGGSSLSRANSQTTTTSSRRTAVGSSATSTTMMAALRAEETRYKREVEHYQRLLLQHQHDASKEEHRLGEKIRTTEEKAKELARERTHLKQRLLKCESDLRSKERERDLLAERLEKQQSLATASGPANPKTEKALRERSEAATAMCGKLKGALDKARQVAEDDRRKIRQLETQMRKLAQDRESLETYVKQLKDHDYPRQLHRAERELRRQEEQHREAVRKLDVSLQEARDQASRYMNELGEATVHATALESELQLAREREMDAANGQDKQLEAVASQLAMTKARLGELERVAKQKGDESDRMLAAANEHIEGLTGEISRLEQEREEVQREMQGRIRDLMGDYRAAKREFESSVRGADDERARRTVDTQLRLDKATKEAVALKAELSELRGILLKKEMAWKDKQIELEGDLKAAASDFEAMQTQLDDQHKRFDGHLRMLDDKARKKEAAWTAERTGLIEKLDAAHKDGFRLRDELDGLRRDTAQVKADCDADLKRMRRELDEAAADVEARDARWARERAELAAAHAEEVEQLREECTVLEQRMQDDRFSLENRLQDALDEAGALREAHDSELGKLADELDAQTRAAGALETQLAEIDARHAAETDGLRMALDGAQSETQRSVAALQDELAAAMHRADAVGRQAESEHRAMEDLRLENSALDARVRELAEANEELASDCAGLQSTVDRLSGDAEYAHEAREDALAHYAQLLRDLDQKHRAERRQWDSERAAMADRLDRLRFRDAMYAIQQDYLLETVDAKEAARAHMVREARGLYDELQDQTAVAYECGDAGAELADDLERALAISASRDADADVEALETEVRALAQHAFVEAVERTQAAQSARARVDGELRELRQMRAHGEMVAAAGEMSAQYAADRARLEDDLARARTDYRGLQELAAANRATFERQLAELRSEAVADAQHTASAAEAAGRIEELAAENAALLEEAARLEDECAGLAARLEEAADADAAADGGEEHGAVLEAQIDRMHQVLEQCEADMTAQVDQIGRMRQYIAEIESERAILAEQSQFQINWLRENYTMAYNELDSVLNNNGGHTNLRQRIRYVETLKTQILTLKKENFECTRERDRLKHSVTLLKSELDAYKEVSDADAMRARSRVRGLPTPGRARRAQKTAAASNAHRSVLEKRGAALASKALEEARQLSQRQMVVADD